MLKVEQLLNLDKFPIQKHKLKAKSKFWEICWKTNKCKEEKERKKNAEWKDPLKTKIAQKLNLRRRTHGTAVPCSMARPCHIARSCSQARPDRAILLGSWSCMVFWRTAVRFGVRPCLRPFAPLFLMSQASLNLYYSPQSSQNAIFGSKTRKFSLKAQKSRNVSKIA